MIRRMGFALVVALLGGPSWAVADEAEDQAVAFVKNLNGYVYRDDKQPGKPVVTVGLHSSKVVDRSRLRFAPLERDFRPLLLEVIL